MRPSVALLALASTLAAGCFGSPAGDGGVTRGPEAVGCETAFRLEPLEGGEGRSFTVVGESAPVPVAGMTYEVWRDHEQSDVARGALSDPGAIVRVTGADDGLSAGDQVHVEGGAVAVILRVGEDVAATDVLCN